MYTLILTLHNVTRWLVLFFGLIAVVRAFSGWLGKREWTKFDRQAGMMFAGMIDLQLLLGLILYFIYTPFTKVMFANFSGAMRDGVTRFFAIEHLLAMLVALVLAHIGASSVKKAAVAVSRHKRAAIWFTATLLLILAMIPWPFMDYGRPLLRLFGFTL
ncbi:MAG: hypothetical protein HPY59_10060 [Anaerolineae bacterium]|nr:hypothetical protein [Anaerolineae bacterium]